MIAAEQISARRDAPRTDAVTEARIERAILVVARAIARTGEATHVPLLERLESELAKMKDARDGVSRARRIVEAAMSGGGERDF